MLSLVLALLAPQDVPNVQVQLSRPENYFKGAVLPMQNCANGSSDQAHFVVGDQKIQVLKSSVDGFLPVRLSMAGEEAKFETADFLLPANAGCSEAPPVLAFLMLDERTPALPHGLFLGPGEFFASDAEVAGWRDSGGCPVRSDHVLCGRSFEEGQKFPTLFVISRNETSRDGGPLFAVCEVKDDFIPETGRSPEGTVSFVPFESLACSVGGSRGEMVYDARLDGQPTIDTMLAADDAATETLDRLIER